MPENSGGVVQILGVMQGLLHGGLRILEMNIYEKLTWLYVVLVSGDFVLG